MLGIIVRVMEMDDAGLVGVHHFLGKQDTTGDVLADLARHVVPLDGVDGGVLVGVLLLDFLVIALDQAEDAVVRGVGLTQKAAGIAVGNIFLGHLESAVGHDGLFHQILNFLYGRAAAHFLAGDLDALGNSLDLQRGHTYLLVHRIIGLGHGHDDLINVENDFRTVTFSSLGSRFSINSCMAYYTIYCGFVKSKSQNIVFSFSTSKSSPFFPPPLPACVGGKVPFFRQTAKEGFEICRGI